MMSFEDSDADQLDIHIRDDQDYMRGRDVIAERSAESSTGFI